MSLSCLGALLLGLGCRSVSPDLEPADPSQEVPTGEDAAMDRSDGLRMIVQTTPWPGQHLIEMEVTPVRVHIANDGSRPVAVRYDDFVIVNERGKTYRALYPHQTSGEVPPSTVREQVEEPRFEHEAFSVAAHQQVFYPGVLQVYDGSFIPSHAAEHLWGDLPTAEMRAWALPEGVVQPGGYIEGYLYFQKVSADDARLTVRATLSKPGNGEAIARFALPFVVEDD